mgnify:CR=1 FL=1|jgi:hypothetical protein
MLMSENFMPRGRQIFPATRRGAIKGIFSFLGKRISPFDPQEKGIHIGSLWLEGVQRLPIALPAWRHCYARRHWLCYTTCLCFYYPLPLCSSSFSAV